MSEDLDLFDGYDPPEWLDAVPADAILILVAAGYEPAVRYHQYALFIDAQTRPRNPA